MHAAMHDAAHSQAPQIVRIVQIRNQHLERFVGIESRAGNFIKDGLEKWPEILALAARLLHGHAIAANGVKHGELKLILVCAKIDKKIVNLVKHFLRAGVPAVNLVDDHNDGKSGFQRLAQHKTRLGQGAFAGVNQQNRPAGH